MKTKIQKLSYAIDNNFIFVKGLKRAGEIVIDYTTDTEHRIISVKGKVGRKAYLLPSDFEYKEILNVYAQYQR